MEFAPHEPVILTEREIVLNGIVDRLFPERDRNDTRRLFLAPLETTDSYRAMQAPTDGPTIRRFSNFPPPEGDEEVLIP